MKSWKTAVCGVLSLVVVWSNLTIAILDGSASTVPNWDAAIALTAAAIGLLLARDHGNKS